MIAVEVVALLNCMYWSHIKFRKTTSIARSRNKKDHSLNFDLTD